MIHLCRPTSTPAPSAATAPRWCSRSRPRPRRPARSAGALCARSSRRSASCSRGRASTGPTRGPSPRPPSPTAAATRTRPRRRLTTARPPSPRTRPAPAPRPSRPRRAPDPQQLWSLDRRVRVVPLRYHARGRRPGGRLAGGPRRSKGASVMARPQAELGVFGGSGFYAFLDGVEEHTVETPFGAPSDKVAIGEVEGRRVAFLPRHGRRHQYPPHKIPYRANLWAMKEVGVSRVIGPCAAGSLQAEAAPGHFVICDQVVDRTWGRDDTFYDGPETTHISFADPYCPELRALALKEAGAQSITVHDGGTMVVIQGPRFSTRAESRWFQGNGWKVINMTGYPEALLARELELCYVNVSLITDYDVGLEGMPGVQPVSHSEVVRVFAENNAKLKDLLLALLASIPGERTCPCATALKGARFEV